MKKTYKIKPIYKSFVWAGQKLIEKYGLQTDLPNVGTIYNVIAIKGDLDNEVEGTGMTLSAFYEANPELFGCGDAVFPVRMTITCNEDYQSYQLHPDDTYALAHEGTRGKVSGSVMLFPPEHPEAKPRRFGHKAADPEHFLSLVAQENWEALFDTISMAPGDYLHTPAGVIHGGKGSGAIAATFGTNSDITYRFYDYGRNDPKRPLHMRQVLDCLHFPEIPLTDTVRPEAVEADGVLRYDYYECPGEYVAKRLKIQTAGTYEYPHFCFYACVDGSGTIENMPVCAGETIFIPCEYGPVHFEGSMDLCMLSYYRR